MNKTKVCAKCGIEQGVAGFSKDKCSKDGFQYTCKLCRREYRKANRDRTAEYQKANKDRIAEYQREYQRECRKAQPSGIYRITCTKSDRFYIGATKAFCHRMNTHRSALSSGKGKNPNLQAEFNLHGPESFTYELVEPCLESDLAETEKVHLEQHMSNKLCCNVYKASSHHHA